jgi:hypothetical protein
MNPIRIAIMTIAAVSATTFTYALFAPSASKVVAKPVQSQVAVLSMPTPSVSVPVATAKAPVVYKTSQTKTEIQYLDVPAPRTTVRQSVENQDGEDHELE